MADLPSFVQVATRSAGYGVARLFLNLRLASRVTVAVMLAGRLGWPVVAACALCAGYDVLLYLGLRRSRPLPLPLRVVLDAVDVAAWSAVYGTPFDPAAMVAAPLAFEAGLTLGWRAAAVPALVGLAADAVTGAVSSTPFLWPGFGMAAGLLVRRYLTGRVHQRLRTAAAEREAARSQAELAGRHSVAVGADTVVDLLTRTWPLLAVPGKRVGSPLAAWRQLLAEETADHAEYLATALLRWEQQHNLASPDLSRDVEFAPEPGSGTLLLSPAQVAALHAELARIGPRGRLAVRVPDPRPLGQAQEVLAGPYAIVLPADAGAPAPPFDPGPILLAVGAIGSLTHSWRDFDGVPLPVGACLALAGLAVAWWGHHRIRRYGVAAHGAVLAGVLAFGALDAVVSTAFVRTLSAGGLTRQPYLHALMVMGPLAAMYLRDVRPPLRMAAVLSMAASTALAWTLLPVPLHPVDVAALVWPLAFTVGASELRDLLDLETSGFDGELAARRAEAVRAGFSGGRADVLRLVQEAERQAVRRLREDRDLIDPVFVPEIERRLDQVRQRLTALSRCTPA